MGQFSVRTDSHASRPHTISVYNCYNCTHTEEYDSYCKHDQILGLVRITQCLKLLNLS